MESSGTWRNWKNVAFFGKKQKTEYLFYNGKQAYWPSNQVIKRSFLENTNTSSILPSGSNLNFPIHILHMLVADLFFSCYTERVNHNNWKLRLRGWNLETYFLRSSSPRLSHLSFTAVVTSWGLALGFTWRTCDLVSCSNSEKADEGWRTERLLISS